MRALALSAAALFVAVLVQAEDPGPRLPFLDWGACPFEGCTYRRWQAVRVTTVWRERDHASPVAYSIGSGEWVEGLTGVVITYKPGVSKVLAPMTLGQGASVVVAPGDILLTLHYLGEGYDLFWFKGLTYQDQIASDKPDPDPPAPELKVQVVSRARTAWWVKVMNKKRQIGWTDQTRNFAHMDALE
jgi:hypothetical protein